MKISHTAKTIALVSALIAFGASQTMANSASDMVVAKMAEGDVAAICSGGRATISAAATKAVTELAKAGKISGDFKAIGGEAGTAFYKAKCS